MKFSLPKKPRVPDVQGNHSSQTEIAPTGEPLVDTPIPLLTWRSFVMGIFVSMGGFCFGYDTGQISGFLEMQDFLQRYGQLRPDGTYYFSNVRSGLIVALVCFCPIRIDLVSLIALAFHWHADRCPCSGSHRRSNRAKVVNHMVVYHALRRYHRPD